MKVEYLIFPHPFYRYFRW